MDAITERKLARGRACASEELRTVLADAGEALKDLRNAARRQHGNDAQAAAALLLRAATELARQLE